MFWKKNTQKNPSTCEKDALAGQKYLQYIFIPKYNINLCCPFHRWYFGKVSRGASEEWLLAPDYPTGTFLVRHGEKSPESYTLSVRDCDEIRGYLVKHYQIWTRRGPESSKECYFISKSRQFPTLAQLVTHYQVCCVLCLLCMICLYGIYHIQCTSWEFWLVLCALWWLYMVYLLFSSVYIMFNVLQVIFLLFKEASEQRLLALLRVGSPYLSFHFPVEEVLKCL